MKKTLLTFALLIVTSALVTGQNRPYDQSGLNMFEPGKQVNKFEKVKLNIGGSFTQSFQTLDHSSESSAASTLNDLVNGFNTAIANLYFDVYLADGVSMNMALYLASRHHNETWVKGGYILFDKLPFMKGKFFEDIMKYAQFKIGHMEINYGDSHFRRSDNGNSIYNPFVENNIMDAFATEIGAEVDVYYKDLTFVGGITNGKIKGEILAGSGFSGLSDGKHHPAFIGKVAYDKNFTEDLRFRVSGSVYHTAGSIANTLYGGDRSGSHYYGVLEIANSTSTAFSGRFNPGFSDKVTSLMGNLFVKFHGLESFTTLEKSSGRSKTETSERDASQFVTDLVYRFGKSENFWLGTKYNNVNATLATGDVKIDRLAFAGGWYMTKNIMAKIEYVNQNYSGAGFIATDLRNNANFKGLVFEAVVGF